MEAVTSVLIARARGDGGLSRMVGISLAVHAVLAVLLVMFPVLNGRTSADDLQPVMTISLGGAAGPRAGGMTMMSRPSQEPAALAEPVKPARILKPPAARAPAMVLPDAKPARPVRPAKAPPAAASLEPPSAAFAAPRVPFGGEAESKPDPNRGMGFGGLSTGGGNGAGGYLEVKNFCCPDYLTTMLQVVQSRWDSHQEVSGETQVKFRILRDGRLTDIELEKSSGYSALDLTAQRALFMTQRLPPLPSAFPDDHLVVHLKFPYQR